MFTHVLVPFDGSVQSQHALHAALEMAKGDEPAHVTVLEVAPPMSFDDTTFEVAARMAGVPEVSEAAKDESQKHVIQDQIQEFFNSVPDNVDIQIVIKNGRPHEVIADYAKEQKVDCIVMGRRGLGAIRAALGSVSSAVLRSVDLPVMVVK